MTLEFAPGDVITIEGLYFTVEEHSAFHDEDFRLDLARIAGPTPAHARWLVAVSPEPYYILMERLEQQWLGAPTNSLAHEGEIFLAIHQGGGFRLRRKTGGKSKEGRVEYAVFRANSGRVIVTVGRNDHVDAWVGDTLPANAVRLMKRAAGQ